MTGAFQGSLLDLADEAGPRISVQFRPRDVR